MQKVGKKTDNETIFRSGRLEGIDVGESNPSKTADEEIQRCVVPMAVRRRQKKIVVTME